MPNPTKTNSVQGEELKKWFEVNYLDGDEIQDGQTLSSQECFEALAQQQSELLERVKEVVKVRLEEVDVVERLEKIGASLEQIKAERTPEWYGRTDELKNFLQSLDSLIDKK